MHARTHARTRLYTVWKSKAQVWLCSSVEKYHSHSFKSHYHNLRCILSVVMRRYLSFPENGVSYMREEKYLLKIRNIEALPSWTCPTGRALQTDGTIPNGKCTSASVERVFNNGVYLLGCTDASKAQCIDCGKLLSLGSNKSGKQTVHGLKCHLEKCHKA